MSIRLVECMCFTVFCAIRLIQCMCFTAFCAIRLIECACFTAFCPIRLIKYQQNNTLTFVSIKRSANVRLRKMFERRYQSYKNLSPVGPHFSAPHCGLQTLQFSSVVQHSNEAERLSGCCRPKILHVRSRGQQTLSV